jgi:hypothetical protein
LTGITHILLDNDFLQLPASRLNKSVVGKGLSAQEDVEHERDSFEA